VLEIIKSKNLNHSGGFYLYRLHELKLDRLCNNGFHSLKSFLNDVFEKRPDAYFNSGPRGSMLRFKLPVDLIEVNGHEVSLLAKHGLKEYKERFQQAHPRVQVFMLENDNSTVAMEVPLWITKNEVEDYHHLFNSNEPLTGHVDVLRIDDNKIWIWDYKPNAHREKYAATQVYFYALMLSKRTGIDLEKFRCGYFDQNYAFIFRPDEKIIRRNSILSDYI